MTRTEFIQQAVSFDFDRTVDISAVVERAVGRANALEASGAAPWGSVPSVPVSTPAPARAHAPASSSSAPEVSGERVCAIFFRTFGGRTYVWAELSDLERQAWEDVAKSFAAPGTIDVAALERDVRASEREGCAADLGTLVRESGPIHAQILMHAAGRIRARR